MFQQPGRSSSEHSDRNLWFIRSELELPKQPCPRLENIVSGALAPVLAKRLEIVPPLRCHFLNRMQRGSD